MWQQLISLISFSEEKIKLENPNETCEFHSIPGEIITHHIFICLSYKNLISKLRLVCKYWNQLISQTPFTVNVNTKNVDSFLACCKSRVLKSCLKIEGKFHSRMIDYFPTLESVTDLSFNHHQVRITNTKIFSKLQNLTALDLSYNELVTDAHVKEISLIPSMRRLNIFCTDIGKQSIVYISEMKLLESLILGELRLEEESVAYLKKLTNLKELNCSPESYGTSAHLSEIKSLNSLILNVKYNKEEDIENISKLTSLNHLKLWNSNINSKGAEFLSNISSFTSFNLSGNVIGDAGLVNIGKLVNLTFLNLSYNGLSDSGITNLGNLTKLTDLNLNGNNFEDQGAGCSILK